MTVNASNVQHRIVQYAKQPIHVTGVLIQISLSWKALFVRQTVQLNINNILIGKAILLATKSSVILDIG